MTLSVSRRDRGIDTLSLSFKRVQVEEKHASFLAEQDVLISRRDANEAEIATLRSRLTRLRRQLDEANHLRDDEANAFLQLLE